MIRRVDEWLMVRTQDAYLWLLDRTGVYAATAFMVVFVLGYGAFFYQQGRVDALGVGVIAITGVVQGWFYLEQDRDQYEAFNLRVRHWRSSAWRVCLMWTALFFAAHAALRGRPFSSASFLCDVVAYGYLATVQIRKREPPERQVWQPVMEGSR